jgi:hypothetical protein
MMISDMEFDRSDLGFELAKEEEEIKIKPLLAAMKCFFGFPLEAGHCCCSLSLFFPIYKKRTHWNRVFYTPHKLRNVTKSEFFTSNS